MNVLVLVTSAKFLGNSCGVLALARQIPRVGNPGRSFVVAVKRIAVFVFMLSVIGSEACLPGVNRRLNLGSAIDSLKRFHVAEESFSHRQSPGRYGTLEELNAAGLIDSELANGKRSGYLFKLVNESDKYHITAVPVVFSETGDVSLYMDETGIIRASLQEGKFPSKDDHPIADQEVDGAH